METNNTKRLRLVKGKFYKFTFNYIENKTFFGEYMGREEGFECMICRKGKNAHCFNIYFSEHGDYETWSFGNEHLPKDIQLVGDKMILNE